MYDIAAYFHYKMQMSLFIQKNPKVNGFSSSIKTNTYT